MMGNDKLKLRTVLAVSMLGLGLTTLAACDRQKDQTPVERASDAVQDGLNIREHEEIKDAAEDIQSAAENAGDAVEKKADELRN